LRFCKRVSKELFRKLYFDCGYMRIYARCVEIVCVLRMRVIFFTDIAGRRWTAITVGAIRVQNAIGTLSIRSLQNFPLPQSFFYRNAKVRLRAPSFIQTRKPNYLSHLPHFALPFAACHGVIDLLQLLNTITANNTNTINFFIIDDFIIVI